MSISVPHHGVFPVSVSGSRRTITTVPASDIRDTQVAPQWGCLDVDGIYRAAYEEAIDRGETEVAARAMGTMSVAVWVNRGLLCRTLASGSLALYEPGTGRVVEIIRAAVEGFDAFAHLPTEERQ
jgi:hypothetical protein